MNRYANTHCGIVWNAAIFFCLVSIILSLSGCAGYQRTEAVQFISSAEPSPSLLEEKWGIRPESLRLSAAGHMLDFRYRVTDPVKAVKIVGDPHLTTYLLDHASKVKLGVPSTPKVGSLRQTDMTPKKDRIYFTIFSNLGGLVKAGSRVTVVMGDFKAENLVVQ